MGIGESVKKGFSVTTKSMGLVAIFFVFGAITNLINLQINGRIQSTPNNQQVAATSVVASLLIVLVGLFLQAGSMGYIRDLIKQGGASLSTFFASGAKYYLRMLLFGAIVALVLGVAVVAGILMVGVFPPNLRIIGVVLTLLVAAAVIYFIVLVFFAPYIIVADEEKTMPAVRRSMSLVKKHILPILGIGGILLLIGFVTGLLTGIVIGLITGAATANNPTATQTVVAVVSAAVNSFLTVFMTGSYMSYYLGIRNNTTGA